MASFQAKRINPHLADDDYLYFRSGNVCALVSADHSELRAYLDSLDRFFDEHAVILKDTRSVTAAKIEVPDSGTFFLKRYNNKGLLYSLRHIFRRPRPLRVKMTSDRLHEAGINTPRITAAAVKRKCGILLDTAYLMTEFVDGIIPLNKLVPMLLDNKALFTEYRDQVVSTLSHLHDNGFRHGDLKINNIYCRRVDNELEVGLLDLDGTSHYNHRLNAKLRSKDISRFIASLIQQAEIGNIQVDRNQIAGFIVSAYEKLSGYELDEAELKKMVTRHLERRRTK